jgi:hypothetical protein
LGMSKPSQTYASLTTSIKPEKELNSIDIIYLYNVFFFNATSIKPEKEPNYNCNTSNKAFYSPMQVGYVRDETHNHKNQPKKTRKQKKMEKKRRKRGEGNKLKGEARSQRKGTKFY